LDFIDEILGGSYVHDTTTMPLIVLLFAVVATIIGWIMIVQSIKDAGLGIVISGVIILIASLLFISYTEGRYSIIGDVLYSEGGYSTIVGHADIGPYLALIVGILLIIFGALSYTVKDKTVE